MDSAEADVLAFTTFPKEHRTKIYSTNPLERVNGEIKRRTDVVGIFPNEAAVTRLVGAILLEQNDEWAIQRRYMSLETLAPISDVPTVSALLHHGWGHDLGTAPNRSGTAIAVGRTKSRWTVPASAVEFCFNGWVAW